MKKFGALIVCICFCVAAVAAAEGVWVDETWREVKRQVDCDGLPLVIDARVLQAAEDAAAGKYDDIPDAAIVDDNATVE